MDKLADYDSMRPYRDHEVKEAIGRLLEAPRFWAVLDYLFPGGDREELRKRLLEIESVTQFQVFFSHHTVRYILDNSSDGLQSDGLENLQPGTPYLFIANHRDIVLDAAIMQYLLYHGGHATSQITFGENLMTEQVLLDMGKLNKMFTFYRGGSRITQYRNALKNSAYINRVIREEGESIWIAQRNGRTKNGDDRTQGALLKMLSMDQEDLCGALAGLNIVPVTISYEWEPCDFLKIRESYISARRSYEKAPMEDLQSILSGITGHKGRIHYRFGTVLNNFIADLGQEELHENEIMDRIALEIDRQIHRDYRLWPANYLAHDLLQGSRTHASRYTEADEIRFESRMQEGLAGLEGLDPSELRRLCLELYANPVINRKVREKS